MYEDDFLMADYDDRYQANLVDWNDDEDEDDWLEEEDVSDEEEEDNETFTRDHSIEEPSESHINWGG